RCRDIDSDTSLFAGLEPESPGLNLDSPVSRYTKVLATVPTERGATVDGDFVPRKRGLASRSLRTGHGRRTLVEVGLEPQRARNSPVISYRNCEERVRRVERLDVSILLAQIVERIRIIRPDQLHPNAVVPRGRRRLPRNPRVGWVSVR